MEDRDAVLHLSQSFQGRAHVARGLHDDEADAAGAALLVALHGGHHGIVVHGRVERRGQPVRGEVAELLAARGLPTTLDPAVDHEAVLAAVQRDKKRRGGRVGFVLLEAPGEVRTGAPVAESDIRAALQELS